MGAVEYIEKIMLVSALRVGVEKIQRQRLSLT